MIGSVGIFGLLVLLEQALAFFIKTRDKTWSEASGDAVSCSFSDGSQESVVSFVDRNSRLWYTRYAFVGSEGEFCPVSFSEVPAWFLKSP